jgi:hypothetical protein
MHNNEHFIPNFTTFKQFVKKINLILWIDLLRLVHDLLKSRSKDCWNNGGMCTHTPPPLAMTPTATQGRRSGFKALVFSLFLFLFFSS